jgi:hypothetical protein
MPIHAHHQTDDVIDLAEFLRIADAADVNTTEGMLAIAEPFAMLGNNRSFLSDFFCDYIRANVATDPLASVVAQSVVLSRNEHYYIRANMWLPEEEVTANEAILFAYNQAHDHNFDLLSLAYCGDGYLTDCYEYNYDDVAGYVGEVVELNPLGPIKHGCGDTLLYIANKDIHFQRAPKTPSVTLNVIPLANRYGTRDQYFFDIEGPDSTKGTISGYPTTIIEQRRMLFDIAKHLADDVIAQLLADIAGHHACRRTRYEALRALKTCDPEAHGQVCWALRDDKAPLIRAYLQSQEAAA